MKQDVFSKADYIILEYIMNHNGCNSHAMSKEISVSWVHIISRLNYCESLGLIRREVTGREKKIYILEQYKDVVYDVIDKWKFLQLAELVLADMLSANT